MLFEILLVILVLFSGLVTLLAWLMQKRGSVKAEKSVKADGIIVEYSKSFFPVLLLVLVLRSFVADPWRIPSGSMKPTLLEGDFVLVGKYKYGLKLPIIGTKLYEIGAPKRGDIVVFRNKKLSMIMIKRIVGLPGEHVQYKDNVLHVNGTAVKLEDLGPDIDHVFSRDLSLPVTRKREQLSGVVHDIFVMEQQDNREYPYSDVVVPKGHYFMMGDNRSNSKDGRSWGFVPEKDILGQALYTLFSWDHSYKDMRWSRFGTKII